VGQGVIDTHNSHDMQTRGGHLVRGANVQILVRARMPRGVRLAAAGLTRNSVRFRDWVRLVFRHIEDADRLAGAKNADFNSGDDSGNSEATTMICYW
jgi:hypothetical protein